MAAPILPHLINGKVKDIFGGIVSNVTVTLTHAITPPLTATTNSDGDYTINLSGLSSQWSDGDSISLKITKTGFGNTTVSTTIQVTGSAQTVNITFTENSDLSFVQFDSTQRYSLFFTLPTHFDGEKVTQSRGLPVHTVLERQYSQRMANLSSGQVEFLGWANPGTADADAGWRIQKLIYGDGNNKPPTQVLWAKGNANFDNIWDDRAGLEYS